MSLHILKFKKTAILLVVATLSVLTAAGALYFDLLKYADQVVDPGAENITLKIDPGEGFGTVAQKLHARGLSKHPVRFKLLARLKGYDKKIRAGEYVLSAAMSPRQLLQKLVSGKVLLYRLTVPEGFTLQQTAEAAEMAGLCSAAEFSSAATNPELIATLGISAKSLEGYLYPDTYFFPKGATAQEIVMAMGERFNTVFKPEWKNRTADLKMSIHAIVTLASIIEKETGAQFERPLISSVFHNRLKANMRLETDPTVIYGIPHFNGNLTHKDLATPTPYNTYVIKGLPPGPIANPGAKAIEAALYPSDTQYLFFVSKQDATHQFSTNIKDHNKAVQKYQLRKR